MGRLGLREAKSDNRINNKTKKSTMNRDGAKSGRYHDWRML